VAESLLPVVVPTRAAAAEAIAAHGVVGVAALDVTTTKASGGGDVRVGASCAKPQVATVDEVAVGEAEIRGDRDGFQVSPSVPALETEQVRAMRWGVAGSEEFCGRALSQCLRKGGTRCPDLPGDSVSRHWDERRVRWQSKGLSRVQGPTQMLFPCNRRASYSASTKIQQQHVLSELKHRRSMEQKRLVEGSMLLWSPMYVTVTPLCPTLTVSCYEIMSSLGHQQRNT
jgi:hypothetical protein